MSFVNTPASSGGTVLPNPVAIKKPAWLKHAGPLSVSEPSGLRLQPLVRQHAKVIGDYRIKRAVEDHAAARRVPGPV